MYLLCFQDSPRERRQHLAGAQGTRIFKTLTVSPVSFGACSLEAFVGCRDGQDVEAYDVVSPGLCYLL